MVKMPITGSSIQKAVRRAIREHIGRPKVVVINPVVWELPPNSDTRKWYFVISCGDIHYNDILRFDACSEEAAVELRAALILTLARERPVVIHDLDDELAAAKVCEVLWPDAKYGDIVRQIEWERQRG